MTEFQKIRLVNSIQIEKTMRVDWQHRYSRFRVIHLLAIFLSFAVALNIKNAAMIVVCQGQDQPPVKLSVNHPRPLAEGVKQLQEKYGWIITYEDPRLASESDLLDETDPKYSQAHPGGRRALTPKGGTLEISYSVSPVTGKPENPRALLQMLLNAHAASANPGRFELKQNGQIFHVIPEQVKDVRGRWVRQASSLNRARQHWHTRRYGTGSGSDRAPVEALSPPAPGRYRSRYRTNVTWFNLVDRFSIVHTGSAIGVCGKERVNRTPMTPTGADHCG